MPSRNHNLTAGVHRHLLNQKLAVLSQQQRWRSGTACRERHLTCWIISLSLPLSRHAGRPMDHKVLGKVLGNSEVAQLGTIIVEQQDTTRAQDGAKLWQILRMQIVSSGSNISSDIEIGTPQKLDFCFVNQIVKVSFRSVLHDQ
jgi:hypothetical protein